jgi:hypothetical protein
VTPDPKACQWFRERVDRKAFLRTYQQPCSLKLQPGCLSETGKEIWKRDDPSQKYHFAFEDGFIRFPYGFGKIFGKRFSSKHLEGASSEDVSRI